MNGSGTESVAATYDWSIDSIAPDTQPIQPLASSSPHRGSVSFAVTCAPAINAPCSDGTDSRDVLFECRLYEGTSPPPDAPPFDGCGQPSSNLGLGGNREVEKTYSGLESNTTYTFEARTIDPSGNAGPVRSREWTTSALQDFATTPDTGWPEITVGSVVKAIVSDGSGGFFVGGDFSRGGTTAQDFARTDLLHVTGGGAVDPAWDPATDAGIVNAMTLHDGVLYVGGSFTKIDGNDRHRIAAIDAGTGEVVGNWAPAIDDGEVRSLAIGLPMRIGDAVNTLYAGGTFRSIAGTSHRKVAEISLAAGTTGANAWDPAFLAGNVNAVAVNERYVYAGGESITSVGGDSRSPTLREIERTPDAHATDWVPDPRTASGNRGVVHSLELRPSLLGGLGTLYVGGLFERIGVPFTPGDPQPTRSRAAEVNLADNGSVTGWNPSFTMTGDPGSVRDFVPLYCTADGENSQDDPTCATIAGGSFDSVGGASRTRLAETDRASGAAHDWNPAADGAVFAAMCSPVSNRCDIAGNRMLAVGGQFANVGGVSRSRLAFFRAP